MLHDSHKATHRFPLSCQKIAEVLHSNLADPHPRQVYQLYRGASGEEGDLVTEKCHIWAAQLFILSHVPTIPRRIER